MNVVLAPGTYIVAVSGGVDSSVLLDALVRAKLPEVILIVAHFDHGIRADSAEDALFVQELAARHGMIFESARAELGAKASEADARQARYEYLHDVRRRHKAKAVVTAHHQDDLIETIILHLLRGTGRRGLSPMNMPHVLRPLLGRSKAELLKYAREKRLVWREDSTNQELHYKRNQIRHQLCDGSTTTRDGSTTARDALGKLHIKMKQYNSEMDGLLEDLDDYLLSPKGSLLRQRFVTLPYKVGHEYMHWWLTKNDVTNIDSNVVWAASLAAKTLHAGKKTDLKNGYLLVSDKNELKIVRDRPS